MSRTRRSKYKYTKFLTPYQRRKLRGILSVRRLSRMGYFKRVAPPEGYEQVGNDLYLHRAVLDKALLDSFSSNPAIKDEVDDWLDLENIDFIEACERAMLEPIDVFNSFKAMKEIITGDNATFNNTKK